MRYEYIRTASHSYMVVRDASFSCAPYKLQMLQNNRIRGLLGMEIIAENGTSGYWYDITGMQPLEYFQEGGRIGWERFCVLVRSICDVMIVLEKYLLDADDLVYEGKRIFQDRQSGQMYFCYVPGLGTMQKNGLQSMLEDMLEHLDHSDPRTVQAGYALYEACARGAAGVDEMMRLITLPDECRQEPAVEQISEVAEAGVQRNWDRLTERSGEDLWLEAEAERKKNRRSRIFQGTAERERKKDRKKSRKHAAEQSDEWTMEDFAELKQMADWDLEEERPTELLSSGLLQGGLWLLYRGTHGEEDLHPDCYPYLVGKKEGGANGVLKARTISRKHARIFLQEGTYYLEDLNSTNGTYINGELIPCQTPYPLKPHDRILFGEEEYEAALLP